MNDLTIILPTYNEEQNIGIMIHKIKEMYPKANIIVADDGSKDLTQMIVKQFIGEQIALLDRSGRVVKGLTVSVMDAILDTKTDYFIVMDSDMQHPLDKIEKIYYELRNDKDLVIGTREKVVCDWPLDRKLMSWIATTLANIRLAIVFKSCKDVMSGFFGGRTKIIQSIILHNEHKFEKVGYKVLFDIMKYSPHNLRKSYVSYQFGLRERGSSKIGKKHIYSLLRAILK